MAAGGVFIMSSPFLFPDPRLRVVEAVSIGVLGLLLALLGGAVSVAVWRNRHRRVDVYEHGVVEQRAARRTEMRWDEVSSLLCERGELVQAAGLVSHHIAHFRLKTQTGKKLLLDHLLVDIDALGEQVELQVRRCMLPKVRARIAAGEDVAFAPFSASQRGLTRGGRTLAWERVAGAEVADGQVRIFARGELSAWARVPYAKLSNALTLLELISEHAESKH
jgi:hypothetical protein